MSTRSSAFALAIGLGIAAFAPSAAAVNLSANGTGQVLIFPYYTVNANQQTMLSVVNTTGVGKVVKVRFREAYNGRSVLDFNLYLSPFDAWTGTVFALSDAGIAANGAGIFTNDRSCTDPALNGSGTIGNGIGYQSFSTGNYTGAAADTGPATDARTREGHIEMILMSDVVVGSPLFNDTKHVNGVPPNCTAAKLETATGYAPPTEDPFTGQNTSQADGGLSGTASIVNVAQGVYYAYSADALDGFSYVSLYTLPGDAQPTLASVNDRNNPSTATAKLIANGEMISATFPSATPGSRALDAVSAVFAANSVSNEYVSSNSGATGTDWVLTFPTKHLYVDAQPGGAIAGASAALSPFDQLFAGGDACLTMLPSTWLILDREEDAFPIGCGFGVCPPDPPPPALCLETNVLAFSLTNTSVLGSPLVSPNTTIAPLATGGWYRLDMSQSGHQLYPATNGNIFRGVPLAGFAAMRVVSSAGPIPGFGAYRHRTTTALAEFIDEIFSGNFGG